MNTDRVEETILWGYQTCYGVIRCVAKTLFVDGNEIVTAQCCRVLKPKGGKEKTFA